MKWIKFSEQKPENEQDIIFYSSVEDKVVSAEFQDMSGYKKEDWVAIGRKGDESIKVETSDYWMPLPEKPQ